MIDKPVDTIPDEVWSGNEPEGISGCSVDGYPVIRWHCKYGGGYTINGRINKFNFAINKKVSIFIFCDTLWILDCRYSCDYRRWVYSNNEKFPRSDNEFPLEADLIEKYLNTEIPNCKAWDMVQARAWELYGNNSVEAQ